MFDFDGANIGLVFNNAFPIYFGNEIDVGPNKG